MSTQGILKWGNSLAFRIPAALARELEVREGDQVVYRLEGRRLIIEPAGPALPEFSQADLERALRKGRPRLVRLGSAVGKESW